MKLQNFKLADTRQVFDLEDHRADGGVPLLKFRLFDQFVRIEHGITTRAGGVSNGVFSTLNLSYTRGDDKLAVDENYHRTASSLHAQVSDFVLTDQTHTVQIRAVTREDKGKGVIKERDYANIDGLVTNEPGVVLAAFFADCVPLLFVDPVHNAVGVSHSGWRGTVERIGRETIRVMQDTYGSKPKDLYCAIGPSICQSCYEVREDVAKRFMEEFPGAGDALCASGAAGKFQLNLWKANETVLLEAGVKKEHLAVTNVCTCCNPNLLFSHRASKGKRGNFGAFIKLVEKEIHK